MAQLSFKGGEKLKAALRRIEQNSGKAQTLKVGFMSGAVYPDGTLVAQVAAIQNFGAPAAGIPARPFFTHMVAEKSKNWGASLGNILAENDYDGKLALGLMGEGIGGQLQQSIVDTNSPALAASTVAAKGFEKPLIDTGLMLNSVQFDVDGDIESLPKVEAP